MNLLTNSISLMQWIRVKKIFMIPGKKIVAHQFLRTNLQNDYNHNINDVDMADHLRNHYQFDYWLSNRRWWWALWMRGMGVMSVNVYLLYVAANLIIWKRKK